MATTHRPSAGRIVSNPDVLSGEPIVRGTRLAVRHIVLILRECGSEQGVLAAYPQLTERDVRDALAYYTDHRTEIDRHIAANLAEE